jgi:hypothetical protein
MIGTSGAVGASTSLAAAADASCATAQEIPACRAPLPG